MNIIKEEKKVPYIKDRVISSYIKTTIYHIE